MMLVLVLSVFNHRVYAENTQQLEGQELEDFRKANAHANKFLKNNRNDVE